MSLLLRFTIKRKDLDDMRNIIIIQDKVGFIARSMGEQLKQQGYNIIFSSLDVEELSSIKETIEAVLLFTNGEMAMKTKDLIFLRDRVVEDSIPMFYIGDDEEELKKVIPEHVLMSTFKRPIDTKDAVKKIDEYIKKYGRHVKKKILVVDDSGVMLWAIKGWLEDKYQVILANSAATAIKYLATNRPDLVLLDYEMPVVDGKQVLEMIRTETEFTDIPVIFLTGVNDKQSIVDVMALKPEGYLLKTMEPAQIVGEIDAFFEKQKVK